MLLFFGIAIIIATALLGHAFINRNKSDGTFSVTGLGKADFTSNKEKTASITMKLNYKLKIT